MTRKYSIQRRMILTLMLGVVMYMLITGITLSLINKSYIQNYVLKYIESTQRQVTINLEKFFEQFALTSSKLASFSPIYDIIDNKVMEQNEKQEALNGLMEQYTLENDKIAKIFLLEDTNKYVLFEGDDEEIIPLPNQEDMEKAKDHWQGIWSDMVCSNKGEYYLPYISRFRDYNKGTYIGVSVMYIKESAIREEYQEVLKNIGDIFLVTSEDVILSHGDKNKIGKILDRATDYKIEKDNFGYYIREAFGSKMIRCYYYADALAYKLGLKIYMISEIDYNQLLSVIPKMNFSLMVAVGILFLVMMLLVCVLTTKVTLRINKLSSKLDRVGAGEQQVSVTPKYNDEITTLERSFNSMVNEIENLIDTNNEAKERQRETELIALQAQINPHFLYNTLDAIAWKAKLEKQTDIEKMVIQLGRFFRSSLNSGKKHVTVEQELTIIKSFVNIEQIRTPGRFQIVFNVDENLRDIVIVKLILQPFVENAIKHGMNLQDGSGIITITVRGNQEYLELISEDNGVGFDINAKTETNKYSLKPSGYGIRNVRERLQLEYKDKANLIIESVIGKGTKVTIQIERECL